jgi:uncharacterized protein YdeI (YjbR/CyaY-like superfamily)
LRLRQSAAAAPGLTYVQALHGALSFGWMEGPRKQGPQHTWLQQFKPRGSRSRWSRLHAINAERLVKAGRMRPPGLKAIKTAKADGRWAAAYDPPGSAKVPPDLLQALAKDPFARAYFNTLGKADLYAIAYRLQQARVPWVRAQRLRRILSQLAKGVRPLP